MSVKKVNKYNVMVECNICGVTYSKSNITKHLKSKAHVKKLDIEKNINNDIKIVENNNDGSKKIISDDKKIDDININDNNKIINNNEKVIDMEINDNDKIIDNKNDDKKIYDDNKNDNSINDYIKNDANNNIVVNNKIDKKNIDNNDKETVKNNNITLYKKIINDNIKTTDTSKTNINDIIKKYYICINSALTIYDLCILPIDGVTNKQKLQKYDNDNINNVLSMCNYFLTSIKYDLIKYHDYLRVGNDSNITESINKNYNKILTALNNFLILKSSLLMDNNSNMYINKLTNINDDLLNMIKILLNIVNNIEKYIVKELLYYYSLIGDLFVLPIMFALEYDKTITRYSDVSVSSKKKYMGKLKNLKTIGIDIDTCKDVDELCVTILDKLGITIVTLKTYLCAISYHYRENGINVGMCRHISDRITYLRNYCGEIEHSNIPSSKEINKYVSWENVLKIYDNLTNLKLSKPNNMKLLKHHLVLSYYVLMPPRRILDYAEMYYDNSKNIVIENKVTHNNDKKNYYVNKEGKGYFIFNNYKTEGTYGTQTFEINSILNDIITNYINVAGVNSGNKILPCNSGNISIKLEKIFECYVGKKLSASMLRHSYIIYKKVNGGLETSEQQDIISYQMAHSVGMQQDYFKKFDIDNVIIDEDGGKWLYCNRN